MHVVWKRPDGFHDASPEDYHVIELAGHSRLWLHNNDRDWYPFRVSGGWQESEATKRLNHLVNLLYRPENEWLEYLTKTYHHSMADNPDEYFQNVVTWLTDLKGHLRGDTWEMEIMNQAVNEVERQITLVKDKFLKAVSK